MMLTGMKAARPMIAARAFKPNQVPPVSFVTQASRRWMPHQRPVAPINAEPGRTT